MDKAEGGYVNRPPYGENDERETFHLTPISVDDRIDALAFTLKHLNMPMTMKGYQRLAQRTANPADPIRLATAGLGVAGEAGELAGAIKKHLSHGHDLDKEHVREELGDVLWYLAEIAAALDMTLEDVALANIAKLQRRYPDGFDTERSKNRGEG